MRKIAFGLKAIASINLVKWNIFRFEHIDIADNEIITVATVCVCVGMRFHFFHL